MLMDYTSTQPIADQLKRLVDTYKANTPPSERRRVYSLLHEFERAAWIPRLFEMVMQNMSGPGRFQDDKDDLHYLPQGNGTACRAVANLLTAYLAMLDSLDIETRLFSTDEAAAYLEMTPAGLRWYMYRVDEEHRISADKQVGSGFVFTKGTLDQFQEELRLQGGHRKSTDVK